jgi:hypothetical protein
MSKPPNTRVQRTRSSPSALRSPLTRCPLGSGKSQRWLGALVFGSLAASGCAASPSALAHPRPGFGQGLTLEMSLGRNLKVGDTSVPADFTLTNQGPGELDGCFGPEWGVNVILESGEDAGHRESVDHPSCEKRFTLSPGQKIEWQKSVTLNDLRAGRAKVNGWLKVVDPQACDRTYGCYDASVASQLMTITIGEK